MAMKETEQQRSDVLLAKTLKDQEIIGADDYGAGEPVLMRRWPHFLEWPVRRDRPAALHEFS